MAESPSPSVTDTVTEAVAPVVDVAQMLLTLAGGAAVALGLHLVITRLVFRYWWRRGPLAGEVRTRCRWSARATSMLGGMLAAAATPLSGLTDVWRPRVVHVLLVAIILSGALFAIRFAESMEASVLSGLDLDATDNADARRRETQATLLRRVAVALIVIVAIAGVLLTFDTVRTVGASLLASAGILGLVAGVAAQNTLGNLIAGIQIAFAESIKMDDVVIVEGEWGNVEEITLTYVVVRTWDRRRVILPTSYFVQTPFQNWTRTNAQVVGVVIWNLDHRTPVDAMRAEFHRLVETHPLWDHDIAALQVVDTTERTIQVRATMTGKNSGDVWTLRVEIREALIAWLRDHHPEALPTTRLLEAAPAPEATPDTQVERRPTPSPEDPLEPGAQVPSDPDREDR
jgi:small-conductance mechanosensitive channel